MKARFIVFATNVALLAAVVAHWAAVAKPSWSDGH
jgi:hypothetical protein